MKLYLSSHRLGSQPSALVELAGGATRAAIVTNAWDGTPELRGRWLERQVRDLSALGFSCDELDLRRFFGDAPALERRLRAVDVVWAVGGNTFVLARAMQRSGFASLATELVGADELVYAGYSAGACVTGPGLEGCQLIDEPGVLPPGYSAEDPALGLGWVPWRIVPHFRSDHEEAALAACAAEYLLEAGLPFRTLRDGQAIVAKDGRFELVGEPPPAR